MDFIKIINLITVIRKENDIKKLSDSVDELYCLVEPLAIEYGVSIGEIIRTALISYNSLMCVPNALIGD